MKCLYPACKSEAITRGLCRTCYNVAQRLVREGQTTFDKLQKEGKMLPSTRDRSKHNWFLS